MCIRDRVCGGSLYWKFNDPVAPNRENMLFPSLMSVIDFYGMPKLAFDYARRAYEDVILAFREEEGKLLVFGCNETLQAYTGELCLYWMDHSGEKRLLARCHGTIAVSYTHLDVYKRQSQHNVHLVVCSTSNAQAQDANVLQSLMESGIKGIIIQPVPVSYTHLSPGEGIPADRLSPA